MVIIPATDNENLIRSRRSIPVSISGWLPRRLDGLCRSTPFDGTVAEWYSRPENRGAAEAPLPRGILRRLAAQSFPLE